jgi:hypothetical protein
MLHQINKIFKQIRNQLLFFVAQDPRVIFMSKQKVFNKYLTKIILINISREKNILLCNDKPLNSYSWHQQQTSGKIARFRADSDPDQQLLSKGNNKTLQQCSGSMPFLYGSGSAYPYHGITIRILFFFPFFPKT